MKTDIVVHPATITETSWYCHRHITQLIDASLQLPHSSTVYCCFYVSSSIVMSTTNNCGRP